MEIGKGPLVSVIIVTRNRPQYLKECLHHLKSQNYDNFEVIVIDSSTDDETQGVVKNYSNVKYAKYFNGKNMAISRNMGIVNSSGKIVAFIDDDSMVCNGWLRELVSSYTDDRIGAVGGRVFHEYMERDDMVDSSKVGRILPTGLITPFHSMDTESPISVDYIVGCNMSLRKTVLKDLGGFDPAFKVLNDIDICMRVKKQGYKIIFSPKACVFHGLAPQELISRRNEDPRSYFYKQRNHLYALLKTKGFKLAYFKTFFWWNVIGLSERMAGRFSLKFVSLLFADLLGKIAGIFLSLKVKILGEKNYLISEKNKRLAQTRNQREAEKSYRRKLVEQQVLDKKFYFPDHKRNIDELIKNWIKPQLEDLEKILSRLNLPANCRILEIGSENSHCSTFLRSKGYNVVSVEVSYEALSIGVPRVAEKLGFNELPLLVTGDILALPFKPRSFDVAFCFSVLHHFQDLGKLIEEV